uniref:Transcription elongation factor 1 homolog n=1 Tax=Solanum tuberosum TaxID=4113 RepID=M1C3B2_SOLTU
MGKRKAKSKPPPKKRMDKLDTVFSCPFCSHGTSVECRIDMKNLIGEANCRICQESFSTTVTDIVNGLTSVNESTTMKKKMFLIDPDELLRTGNTSTTGCFESRDETAV